MPFEMDGSAEPECIGFVEPKSHNGIRNTIHIENIKGCGDAGKEPFVEDVLVVWCATRQKKDVTVVGWYQHATVWRDLQGWTLRGEGGREKRGYNVRARAEDCTLLPVPKRNNHIWAVPSARYTKAYGFGQSMVWYPTEPEAQGFVSRLVENIAQYRGENWLHTYPEENGYGLL